MESLIEPGFWALEFILVSLLLLGAYRLRPRLGLSAVVAVVVSLQFFQAVLASSFYWEVADGLFVSPGSAILFASNLALLLYVFARDGIITARILLYAIVIGNVVPHLMGAVLQAHIEYGSPHNFLEIPEAIFHEGFWAAVAGVAVLYVDQLLALLGFSWLTRRFSGLPVAIPFAAVLMAVLAFDSVVYLTLIHFDHESYRQMLVSGVVAKSLGGLAFGMVWGVYLQRRMLHPTDDLTQILRFVFFRDDLEKLREAASRDALTGLYNRRTFEQAIEQMLEDQSRPCTLMLCDVDHFKQVNDTVGHQFGDEVLKDIADHLTGSVREMDLSFRMGGDEFAVLLPRCDIDSALEVAERLGAYEFTDERLAKPVTLTLGLASFPADGTTLEELYRCADSRLYQGKRSGRCEVVSG